MNKTGVLLLAVALVAVIAGWYQWQRAEATEEYGYNYVQHAIDVIDESNLSQASKDSLVQQITEGAPDYRGALLEFSDSQAALKSKGSFFLFRKIIRAQGRR